MVHKLKLIKSSILLRLRWESAFRSNVVMGFLGQIVVLYGSIITIFVLFRNTESIAGWSKAQFLALIATHEILRQLNQCFFLQGLRSIPTLVQRGSLDLYLIRPCWTPFLIVIKGIDISKLWRILLGLGVLIYAVSIAPSIALLNFLLYFISLIISLMIFVLLNFCLVCLSFWLISVNNLYFIVDDLYQFGKYPVSVYQGFVRIILTTVLPLVLLSSYPVMLLTNGIVNINLFFHQLVVLAFFIFLAYILWNSGLKVYQSSY